MKQSYSFNTDRNLCVKSWDDSIAELTNQTRAKVLGKKYYEVFPRIVVDEKDALLLSQKSNKRLVLKEYCFHCLMGSIKSDVIINPPSERIDLIKVTISLYTNCAMANKFEQAQQFIDLGRTATMLAHGVRNPLNAIKGAVVYLREKYAREKTLNEFTEIMEEEISRLDNAISKFLSGATLYAERSKVNLNALLKKLSVFTSLQAHTSHIIVQYEYGDIPDIMADSFQIEQAILNVINNSIEAMNAGGQLSIKTSAERNSAIDYIVIEISDTGKGFSESVIDNMGRSFEERGRGFGLSITRETIQYYGGHLEIKSGKDSGTTVKLCFPV